MGKIIKIDACKKETRFLFWEMTNRYTKLVWTNKGLFKDYELSGTSLITNNHVFRKGQYMILGNVIEFLIKYRNNKEYFDQYIKLEIDFNDFDCCADGHITVKNLETNQFDLIISIPFNHLVHEKIKQCLTDSETWR